MERSYIEESDRQNTLDEKIRESYSKADFEAASASLRQQTRILDELTDRTIGEARTTVLRAVGLLAVAFTQSCESVLLLVEHDQIRDAFVTARTALLTAINCCFIFAKGEEAASRAHRHAVQKGIRDLDRVLVAGELKVISRWAAADAAKSAPEFQSYLKEFTTKRGKEQKQWTSETVEQQIDAIGKKYGTRLAGFLLIAMLYIYRHASEIAHGTLFGEWWFLGFTNPESYPVTRDDLNLGPRERATVMMICMSFCVFSLVSIFAQEYPSVRDVTLRSDEVMKGLVAMIRGQTK